MADLRINRLRLWQCLWVAFSVPLMSAVESQVTPINRYPNHALRLVIPSAPGGGTDLIARLTAQKLNDRWGYPVIVENMSGAATTLGTQAVVRSAPDGNTFLMTTVNFAFIPAIHTHLPYDPAKDLIPVIKVATQWSVLAIHPQLPVYSVKALIAMAKKNPNQIRYSTGGMGSVGHLSSALFAHMAGIELLNVPYKGTGPGLVALMSGEVQMVIVNLAAALPFIQSGKLRALAVTSLKRSDLLPQIPTLNDSGVTGYEFGGWYGVWLPAKTPLAIVEKLNNGFNQVLEEATLRERFLVLGIEPVGGSAQIFSQFVNAQFSLWQTVARQAKININAL